MKVEEFKKDIEEYYNLFYSKGTLKYLKGYLEKHNDLKLLLETTIKNFPGQYKTLPDIAVFESYTVDKKEPEGFQYHKVESPISGYIDNLYKEPEVE